MSGFPHDVSSLEQCNLEIHCNLPQGLLNDRPEVKSEMWEALLDDFFGNIAYKDYEVSTYRAVRCFTYVILNRVVLF